MGPLHGILLINSTNQWTTRLDDACVPPHSHLIVRHTQLSTIGDHTFPVAIARVNGLPGVITFAPSLDLFSVGT